MRYCLMLLYSCYPIQVAKHDNSESVVKNEASRNLRMLCFFINENDMLYILKPTKSSLNKSKASVNAFSFAE